MRFRTLARVSAPAAGLALALLQTLPTLGDEPSRLGRLFRLGSSSGSTSGSAAASSGAGRSGSGAASGSTLGSSSSGAAAGRPASLTMGDRDLHQPIGDNYAPPALSTASPHAGSGSGTGAGPALTPTPRIAPKPRVNKGVTEADPLVSRIALGRADGGSQFAMVTQVYADGTVIDSTGVHKIGAEMLKPVVEAIGSGDFGRIKGHCGGPAGDTFENFQVVTYERAYGRLRANAFSYSGNPQGCDHAVFHLHKVLDDLQMKMATPSGGPTVASAMPAVVDAAAGPAPAATDIPFNTPLTTPSPTPVGPSGPLPMPGLPDPGLHD